MRLSEDWGVPWPSHVYHWHREGFDCPAGAETLATGDDFPTQAIRAGQKAFGLQFHPEVTHAMMCRWTVMAEERLRMPGAQDRIRQSPDASSTIRTCPAGSTGSSIIGSMKSNKSL